LKLAVAAEGLEVGLAVGIKNEPRTISPAIPLDKLDRIDANSPLLIAVVKKNMRIKISILETTLIGQG
jgi:hypothetical protein